MYKRNEARNRSRSSRSSAFALPGVASRRVEQKARASATFVRCRTIGCATAWLWQKAAPVSVSPHRASSEPASQWHAHWAGSFLRRLSLHGALSEAEGARLLAMPVRPRRVEARMPILEEGTTTSEACVLVEGRAFRYKTLSSGARQILSFHLPGDIINLGSTLLSVSDYGIATLTDSVVAHLPHEEVLGAMADHRGIARAFWRDTLIEGAISREWLVNIGRRDAFGRLAHLLCETALRCAAAGIGRASRFDFPVTQNDLADATAMTAVHVNRTLQRLRGEALVSLNGREVRIERWDALAAAGGFDQAYLHLPASIAA